MKSQEAGLDFRRVRGETIRKSLTCSILNLDCLHSQFYLSRDVLAPGYQGVSLVIVNRKEQKLRRGIYDGYLSLICPQP